MKSFREVELRDADTSAYLKISWKKICPNIAVLIAAIFNCAVALPKEDAPALRFSKDCRRIAVETVRRIELPKGYHEGIYIGGGSLWVANGKGLKIWVIDMASGKVLGDIEPIATFTEAVALAPGGGFFVSDWIAKKVYRARLEADTLKPESEFSVAPAFPAGILWKDGRLYVITWTRGFGTKFHLVEMDEAGVISDRTMLKGIQEPAHLASDGKNLWITSWYSRRVYRVDLARRLITGYFRTPFPRATGIAWDGEHLWITGTSADLYQVKVKE
jgi:hypothetical protein